MDPDDMPLASAVGTDIPDRGAPTGRAPTGRAIETAYAFAAASPARLIRAAIEKLRGPDGRGADRHASIAITELESALLRLNAADVL